MRGFKQRVLDDAGYADDSTPCIDQDTSLCPYIALPDLFGTETPDSRERVQGVLNLLPQYFLAAFVNRDGPDSTPAPR